MKKAANAKSPPKPTVTSEGAALATHERELLIKLEFICTETGEPSKYEVPADADTLKDLWSRTLSVTCPQCRQIHQVPFRAAYVRAAIDAAAPAWAEQL